MSSETLSDDEVTELQARPSTELGGYRRVLLRPRERDALCATVRALREQFKSMKSKVAWHRDGVGPDVPVLQERYHRLIAERNKFSKLADERHDLLSAEKRASDALREQLAATENELRRRRNGDELPSGWTVMDAGGGFPNLYLYSRADIVAQAKARLEALQSELAQVTQERDEYRERLLKATETEVKI